jgi:hypothetical protein
LAALALSCRTAGTLRERRSGSMQLAPTHHDEAKEPAAEESQGGGLGGLYVAKRKQGFRGEAKIRPDILPASSFRYTARKSGD